MNWRVVGAVVLAAAILLCVQSFRVHRLKADLQDAKAETLQAQIQATLSDRVRTITETLHTRETIVREVAHEAADDVRSAPGGSAVLDPGLRDRWAAALVRVREAGAAQPDDPGSAEPAGAVPEG